MTETSNRDLHLLFLLIDAVLDGECGDGDVHVHCKYRSKEHVADLYEKHISEFPHSGLKRYPYNPEHKVVLFSDGSNENVSFSDLSDRIRTPEWLSLEVTI
jgi:hypothetical protein